MKLKELLFMMLRAEKSPSCNYCSFGDNRVLFSHNGVDQILTKKIPGLNIVLEGKNNTVRIGCADYVDSELVILGDNAHFSIGESPHHIFKTTFILERACSIHIGTHFSSEHNCVLFSGGGTNQQIRIGNDCMFSHDILLRTSDGHIIYDEESGKPLNQSKDIEIGDHTWVGARTTLFKGTKIANNTIVGAMSFVSKYYNESNVILAGIPAKPIRTGVNWRRDNYDF